MHRELLALVMTMLNAHEDLGTYKPAHALWQLVPRKSRGPRRLNLAVSDPLRTLQSRSCGRTFVNKEGSVTVEDGCISACSKLAMFVHFPYEGVGILTEDRGKVSNCVCTALNGRNDGCHREGH